MKQMRENGSRGETELGHIHDFMGPWKILEV